MKLVVPRPREEPTLDREELEKKAAVSPQPLVVNDMDSHLSQLAAYLSLNDAPTAPSKVCACVRARACGWVGGWMWVDVRVGVDARARLWGRLDVRVGVDARGCARGCGRTRAPLVLA